MKRSLLVSIFALLLSAVMLIGCSKQDPNAPDGYKTASNDNVDYTLFVPEDWVVDTDEKDIVISARVSEQDRSNITMMSYDVTDDYIGKTDDEGNEISPVTLYWADYTDELAKTFDNDDEGNSTFKLETDGSNSHFMGKDADGKDVPAYTYVYTGKIGGVELKFMQVISYDKTMGTFYFLTFTAPADRYDAHIETVEELLTHIVFD